MKIQTDLEQVKNPSIIKIANYLIDQSANDSLIAQTLDKPNKSLSEMWKYIYEEARKQKVDNASIVDDMTVYGWAQHYYDEDSIVMDAPKKGKDTNTKVAEIELPEEDLDVFDF